MIQGRYVKDNNYVEVKLENGITEIWPLENAPLRELQVFTLKPKKQKKHKPAWHRVLIITSIILPYILMYTIGRLYEVNLNIYYGCFVAYVTWLGLVIYANVGRNARRRRRA